MNFRPLHRQEIYRSRVFDVEKVTMQLPDGKVRDYDLVKHAGAVTIVPVDLEGNILFVRQYRIGAEKELLELPAGVINNEEAPEIAAAREVREETGMAAGKLTLIGNFYLAPGYSSEYMHVYLATDLYHAPLQQDEDEFLHLEAVKVEKALQMAHAAQIYDGKTLAALLLAQPHLQGH